MEPKPKLTLIPKTVVQTHDSQIQPSYCGVIPDVGGKEEDQKCKTGGLQQVQD